MGGRRRVRLCACMHGNPCIHCRLPIEGEAPRREDAGVDQRASRVAVDQYLLTW